MHFFRTKNRPDLHKKASENKYFSNAIMLSENTKILEFNQYQKSGKPSFIICAELE